MNRNSIMVAIALLVHTTQSPAAPAEFAAVGDKADITLDPTKSYLIVQTSSASSMFSFPITFVRKAEKADIDDYVKRRAAALEKARAKWVKKHAEWSASAEAWDKMSSEARGKTARPVEPVEPTDLNLAFPALDRENMVTIGPFNRFSKAGGRSTFLHLVRPGRYVFYGPVNIAAGVGGTCMCMGSIAFDVKPGQIVYAGMMKLNWMDERAKAKAEGRPLPKTEFDLPDAMNMISWDVPTSTEGLDTRLSSYKISVADLQASGRIPNYFGLQIDRLTEIPNILRYDRDRIIDGRTGATVK